MSASEEITFQTQLSNWESFCRYHAIGDWHGVWTRYDSEQKIIESFKCIRSFRQNVTSTEVIHENHYVYADGKKETKTFQPYHKPNVKGLFVKNSFSWGSTKVENNSNFGFETGFKSEERGVSVAAIFDCDAKLKRITFIVENLAKPITSSNLNSVNHEIPTWQGIRFTAVPDSKNLLHKSVLWSRIEDLGNNYFILHHSNEVSVACPQQLNNRDEFVLVVDWQISPSLLQRGTRTFEKHSFKSFSLENFSLLS